MSGGIIMSSRLAQRLGARRVLGAMPGNDLPDIVIMPDGWPALTIVDEVYRVWGWPVAKPDRPASEHQPRLGK